MSGSTIINQRQHVGLQKLSALSAMTTQFLGPTKTYKFIRDDATGESALVSSCRRVLQNLELTCAVSQLVHETIEAHHKIYKTGSGCLLFMVGAWSRAALECLHRGIPIGEIISAMSEGMDICLTICKQCSISFQEIKATPKASNVHPSAQTIVKDTANHQLSCNNKAPGKLKLSRHFHELEYESRTQTPLNNIEKSRLADIARTLCHGSMDSMDLVLKASQIQSDQFLTFDPDKISSCSLPDSSVNNTCVIPGCIVLTSSEQAVIALHLEGQDLNVALISGDLTPSFRHLGYNKPKGLRLVCGISSSEHKNEEWSESVMRLLLNLKVNLILISGICNGHLKDHFWRHQILVVEKVKLSILKTFAISSGAILVSYATQLNSKCVGSGITLNVLKDFGGKSERSAALNISTAKSSGLVTVVLTSCLQAKLQSLEDTFWACTYRLHWALQDKALLPGAGVTEMICVCQLQRRARLNGRSVPQINPRTAAARDTGVVLQLMADGFIDFISSIMANTGRYSKVEARTVVTEQLHDWDGGVNCAKFPQMSLGGDPDDGDCTERTICDNLIVKQEVWRKALDLVLLVLQTDAEVITGVDQKNSEQRDLIFL